MEEIKETIEVVYTEGEVDENLNSCEQMIAHWTEQREKWLKRK